MSRPTEFHRVESVVRSVVGKPLAVVVFGLWIGGRFMVRKAMDFAARFRASPKMTQGKAV